MPVCRRAPPTGFGNAILSEPTMEGPTLNQFPPSGKSRQTAPDQAGIRSLWMVYPIVSPCSSRALLLGATDPIRQVQSPSSRPRQCRIPSLQPQPAPGLGADTMTERQPLHPGGAFLPDNSGNNPFRKPSCPLFPAVCAQGRTQGRKPWPNPLSASDKSSPFDYGLTSSIRGIMGM